MVHDFLQQAVDRMDPGAHGYFAGGAGDELTLQDNHAAWSRWALCPRVLVDVSRIDPGVDLLGRRRAHPMLVAPMAYQRHAHPDGELAMARAAAATDTPFVLSSQTTTAPVEVADALGEATGWFQLYVFKDRAITDELVHVAKAGGFEALVLTVDFPHGGWRERDLRSGFTVTHPTFVDHHTGPLTPTERHALHDPSLTWDDIAGFAEATGLPVVLKGILRPDDAERAVEAGVAGIVVSNHGGRQLDTVLSGADALRGVVEAVDGRLDVMVDGGIRRGWDVAKALALGADAVLIGRTALWGLACEGQAGAQTVLEQLQAEFVSTLGLLGCPSATDLDESYVTRRPR